MNDFNLSEYLKPWALRLLQSSKVLDRLLAHAECGHEAIAEWLGFTTLKSSKLGARKKHLNTLYDKYLKGEKQQLPDYIQSNFAAFAKLGHVDKVYFHIKFLPCNILSIFNIVFMSFHKADRLPSSLLEGLKKSTPLIVLR